METKTYDRPGEDVYYTLEDKHFFAVQYNAAMHNVFITLNYIFRQTGQQEIEDDGDILVGLESRSNRLKKKSNPIVREKFYNLLDRHFPFIKMVDQFRQSKNANQNTPANYEQYPEILLELLKVIKEYRNYFSHSRYEKEIDVSIKMAQGLNAIWDNNINVIKRDFLKWTERNGTIKKLKMKFCIFEGR